MTASIVHASSTFLSHLLEPALRSLLLGCLATLALAVSRVKDACFRLLAWKAVLGAALAMPLLGWLLPAFHFSLPGRPEHRLFTATKAAPLVPRPVSHPPSYIESARREHPKTLPMKAARKLSSPSRHTISWSVVAAAIYVAVALMMFIRVFAGFWVGRRLDRASPSIDDRQVITRLALHAHVAGIKRKPRLAESEMLIVPATIGTLHPVILLPSDWRDWDEHKLDAVLAHEVSHVARHDGLTQILSLLHRAIYWFSPLGWWLHKHLIELAEEASDEAALAAGIDRTRYAEALLNFLAAVGTAPGRVWWQGAAMAKVGPAEKRVDRILAWRHAMSSELKKSLIAGLVLVASPAVYVTATARPQANRAQPAATKLGLGQAPAPAPLASPTAQAMVLFPGSAPPANLPTNPQRASESTPSTEGQAPLAPCAPLNQLAGKCGVAGGVAGGISSGVAGGIPSTPGTLESLTSAYAELQRAYKSHETAVRQALESSYAQLVREHEIRRAALLARAAQTLAAEQRDLHFGIAAGNSCFGIGPSTFVNGPCDQVNSEVIEHIKSLRNKVSGDFIWFARAGKSYIVQDQATVNRAKQLFDPLQNLNSQQEELGKQQEELGRKQEALGKQMGEIRVQVPAMDDPLRELEAKLKQLTSGGTQEQLAEVQERLAEIQARIADLQSRASDSQSELADQQASLGAQQAELGERQAQLATQQQKIARKALGQIRKLLDDTLVRGVAQPEIGHHPADASRTDKSAQSMANPVSSSFE